MTTIDDRHDDGTSSASSQDGADDGAPVSKNTAVQSLVRSTRALTAPSRRTVEPTATAALREQVAVLVGALGDPGHPLHHRAVNDLTAIGEAAVPALIEALRPHRPWLTAYRAAEALGQIGDGRAAGPLIEALNHPNSNVRWGAIRALATVGDARALFELRRVARDDRSKTSWGESVGDAARSVLDQMQSRTLLVRVAELVKTAAACVLMLMALILAWSVLTELRDELSRVGRAEPAPVIVAPPLRTAVPQAPATVPTSAIVPAPVIAAPRDTPVVADQPAARIGTIVTSGNVRATPARQPENVIGSVASGDQVVFLAVTPDGEWYRVRLGPQTSTASQIRSVDGSGWVSSSLVSAPGGDVPVETPPAVPAP